jgi:squalene-hopene/tetraprenyl-beta-curcumene cyclase
VTVTVSTTTDSGTGAVDLRVDRLEVIPGRTDARTALDAAVTHLRGLQDKEGWWQGELETNVTMDAEDLLLRGVRGAAARR